MYTLNVSYGDVDAEPEMATVETLGTYKTLDEACEAAEDKFRAIMESLGDAPDIHYYDIAASYDNHYVIYGYIDPKLGYVDNEQYYMVSVVER